MRISDALEIAEKSLDSFEAELENLSIKELYELADNLRFTDNPKLFEISRKFLVNKLREYLEGIEGIEVTKPEGADKLRKYIYEETGLHLDSETSPSAGMKEFINKILSWQV